MMNNNIFGNLRLALVVRYPWLKWVIWHPINLISLKFDRITKNVIKTHGIEGERAEVQIKRFGLNLCCRDNFKYGVTIVKAGIFAGIFGGLFGVKLCNKICNEIGREDTTNFGNCQRLQISLIIFGFQYLFFWAIRIAFLILIQLLCGCCCCVVHSTKFHEDEEELEKIQKGRRVVTDLVASLEYENYVYEQGIDNLNMNYKT
jgi:hypothetical protein